MAITIICVGAALILVTTVVHAAAMHGLMEQMRAHHALSRARRSALRRVAVVSGTVLALLLATILEAAMWAGAYLALGALPEFEAALYFSMVTYTTLGYGDVVLSSDTWRLLAGVEAANGVLMLGWSTALTLAVIQRLYASPK